MIFFVFRLSPPLLSPDGIEEEGEVVLTAADLGIEIYSARDLLEMCTKDPFMEDEKEVEGMRGVACKAYMLKWTYDSRDGTCKVGKAHTSLKHEYSCFYSTPRSFRCSSLAGVARRTTCFQPSTTVRTLAEASGSSGEGGGRTQNETRPGASLM